MFPEVEGCRPPCELLRSYYVAHQASREAEGTGHSIASRWEVGKVWEETLLVIPAATRMRCRFLLCTYLPLVTRVRGSSATLGSLYCDLDLGRGHVLEPEHVTVAVLLRAAALLVEVLPTHVHGEKPLAYCLRGDEGGPDVHEPLLAIAFGRP